MNEFECQVCQKKFTISDDVLSKFPNWKPKYCIKHKNGEVSEEVTGSILDFAKRKYSGGPSTGIFTDGSSRPNPGPGGWGAVWVKDNEIVKQINGSDPNTTNNRMELTALINGLKLVSEDLEIDLYTDSELCSNIINKWMAGWKARGWKKKDGEIKNLDLIKQLDEIVAKRPNVKINWIKAHNGNLWNEYVDLLSDSWNKK